MAIHAARPSCIPACLVFLALSLGVADAKGRLNEPDPMCTGDASVRLRIENRCADDVWAVVTSPGGNAQIAVRAQWDWINAYASQTNTIDTGWKVAQSNGTSLTIKEGGFEFTPGMKILIVADRSQTKTTVASWSATDKILTLEPPGVPSGTDVTWPIWYYNDQNAFEIRAGATQGLCVPKTGAPGGNFRFFMGCPGLGTDDRGPFHPPMRIASGVIPGFVSCVIGSPFGDAAAVNTLFEPSFGCVPGTSSCAFNPGDGSGACQSNPSAATCGPISGTDFYDLSVVDGYTLPMKLEAKVDPPGECDRINPGDPVKQMSVKDAFMLDLASCPTESNQTIIGTKEDGTPDQDIQAQIDGGISLLTQDARYFKSCAAPHLWFSSNSELGTPRNKRRTATACGPDECNSVAYYAAKGCQGSPNPPGGQNPGDFAHCPQGSGPQQKVGPKGDGTFAIQNTNFVQQLRALGYPGYTWQYDDGIGTQTCTSGATVKVTLCPDGGPNKPYLKSPLWKFSDTDGKCFTDGSAGTPDGNTTFGSLFACQKARMRYTCTDLTESDPFKLPIGVWAADAAATRASTSVSRTYGEFQAAQGLLCEDTPPIVIKASSAFVGTSPTYPNGVRLPNCTYYADKANRHICPVP